MTERPDPISADCAKLFWIVPLLVDKVHLIEYFPCFFQADTVFSLDLPALLSIELKPHRPRLPLYHSKCEHHFQMR